MNLVLRDAQRGYGENTLVHPGELGEEGVSNKDATGKESAMFTVRFFDILTGVHGVSHPAAYKRTPIGKNASKGMCGWLKRH
ncbi:MAG: hypothetical protein ACR2PF_13655 [Rhizobiaceae bacterium]